MKEPSILINQTSFPNQQATDSEKETIEYGRQVGESIQYEWFKRSGNSCRFYDQWVEFHRLRLYARGEQPIGKYKNEISVDGDLSYLNLDWTPVPIIPKFVDIVVNGMADRLFDVKAVAQDAMSAEKKHKFQEIIEADMVARPMLEATEAMFGIDMFNTPKQDLPESNQELSLYMQMNYKPAMEIAEEEAIDTILEQNHYKQRIQKQVNYDLMVLGTSFVKHQFLPNSGISVEYVDPASLVYSYTESPTFDDCFYFGEVKQVPITELVKINPDISLEEMEEISQMSSLWYNYYGIIRPYQDSLFQKDVVTLLYYNYKTTRKMVYKKKYMDNGGEKVIRKEDSFNPPVEDQERFEKLEKRIDVWYEGIMVMGTQKVIKWELAKNMVRPKSASQYALPNYIGSAPRMYKGNIESLVRRMITFADLIQVVHLKLQQVISRVVPDGVFIDADGLNEVDLGTGAAYNPEDALKLYFQTGSVIGRSYTQDGEFNNARVPIQELGTNSGQAKMASLISTYNHYLNMIRDVTGLNEARDASTPNPDALVGLQKLAALNSNVATRHILEGNIQITQKLAEALSCRIADVLEYAEFKEEFAMQIGKYNVSILNDVKDLYLHDFGVFLQVAPDEEQKAQLEANIQIAMQRDQISLEDAIDIREIKNLKMANELLKLKRRKKQEQDVARENQKMEMQGQMNMQSQQAASQSKMQSIQAEMQAKIEIEKSETEFAIQKLQQEAILKKDLMAEEFMYQMQLKGVDVGSLQERERQREDAKSSRISKQNTEQSKLIQQRQDKLPPINFESNEDSLDGFDFAEFNPR
jgi:hypothetical protein|tara:strand:+ start:3677 stop:6109 length:2433 start_codon:yes stop_codon:yes gene_type:complete